MKGGGGWLRSHRRPPVTAWARPRRLPGGWAAKRSGWVTGRSRPRGRHGRFRRRRTTVGAHHRLLFFGPRGRTLVCSFRSSHPAARPARRWPLANRWDASHPCPVAGGGPPAGPYGCPQWLARHWLGFSPTAPPSRQRGGRRTAQPPPAERIPPATRQPGGGDRPPSAKWRSRGGHPDGSWKRRERRCGDGGAIRRRRHVEVTAGSAPDEPGRRCESARACSTARCGGVLDRARAASSVVGRLRPSSLPRRRFPPGPIRRATLLIDLPWSARVTREPRAGGQPTCHTACCKNFN